MDCPAVGSTQSYTMTMPAQVTGGVLRAELGVPNVPGWTRFEGRISPNGSADIIGTGITGTSSTTVGQPPPGSAASYHYVAQFDGNRATGQRVGQRPCSLDAIKMQ